MTKTHCLVGAVIGSSLSAGLFRIMVDRSLPTGGVSGSEWLARLKESGAPVAPIVWASGFELVVFGVFAILSLVPVVMIIWYAARYSWKRRQQKQVFSRQEG